MNSRVVNELGTPQLTKERMVVAITERIRCARSWCQKYWQLLCNPDLRCQAKFQLYKLFVRPILTYGCEVWKLESRLCKKLLRFECGILLEIYKSKYPHRHPKRLRPSIRAVYRRYRDTDVVEHVKNERLSWRALLEIEERALERNSTEPERYVHWLDQTTTKAAHRKNCTNRSSPLRSILKRSTRINSGTLLIKNLDRAPD
jgi:hypothetical protein